MRFSNKYPNRIGSLKKFTTPVAFIVLIVAFFIVRACFEVVPQPPRRVLSTSAATLAIPTYDETQAWDRCHAVGYSPAGYVQEIGKGIEENPVCYSGKNADGSSTYMGACACDYRYLAVQVGPNSYNFVLMVSSTPTNTSTLTTTPSQTKTVTPTWTYTNTMTMTPTRTMTKTPSPTPSPTPTMTRTHTPIPPTFTHTMTPTPINAPLCVQSVWYRTLNTRYEPSMFNYPYQINISYGAIVPVESVLNNLEGTWAQINDRMYFAMYLKSNNRTYAKIVTCP